MRISNYIFSLIALSATIGISQESFAQPTQAVAHNQQIDQAVAQLNQYRQLQSNLKLQDPDLSYGMRKALVMADLLFTTDGQLNLSLIPDVKAAFVPQNPEEFEVNMGKVLDQLDAVWQHFFAGVTLPKDPAGVAMSSLRAFFSAGPQTTLTDRHAKVAVLAAMFAPYNQGPVGDCFAVSDVLRDHKEFYQHAANDYAALVMNGYLTRPVDNKSDYFFYLPVLADDDRENQVAITPSGTFSGTTYSIFDSPGFLASRTLMGGDDSTCSATEVAQVLFQGSKKTKITATPNDIIQAMAAVMATKSIGADPVATTANLTAVGKYGFSSLTNNPILRGIEAAFAAMAEDRINDSTRSNINSSVSIAMKPLWQQVQKYSGVPQFNALFTSLFNNSYRLVYNPDYPLPQVAADGSSSTGAFVLFKRDPTVGTNIGTAITTPQQLGQLVADAVTATANSLPSNANNQAISNLLSQSVTTKDFLTKVLWAYDPSNQQEPDPVDNYTKLSRTPMLSPDGDNPFEVDDIDTETAYEKNVQTYVPHNTKDLVSWCMNMAKTTKVEMAPMDSPQHAFNFMPKNPDLTSFVNSNSNPNHWIQKTLVVPGMQVATRQIDPLTQNALSQGMWELISEAFNDPSPYQNLVRQLAKSKLSVQVYSQKLLNGINSMLNSDSDQAHRVANALDAVLLQSLPAKDQTILQQSAIRFAFTNWNEGLKDIYFCAFFNPRTEQVAFGTILEDKTNLQPMDETEWVNNQQWDVDLTPNAPANAASF